jgi:transposase
MIGLPSQGRIYLRRAATDMRKSFDGLSGLVRGEFGQDPLNGDLFVFLNRRRGLVKVLYWERDGFAIWAKRLERGRFMTPAGSGMEVDRTALTLLLEGVKARVLFRSPRWQSEGRLLKYGGKPNERAHTDPGVAADRGVAE